MPESGLDLLLTDPAFGQDPYPAYQRLREEGAIHWSEAWGAWLQTRFDDIVASLRDHELFSSQGRLVELAADNVEWQGEKALFRCVRSLPVRAGRRYLV